MRLRDFIAEKNPQAARQVSHRLVSSIRRLADQPEMGIDVPGLSGVRDLVTGDYILRYTALGDDTYILRIWHGKEDR